VSAHGRDARATWAWASRPSLRRSFKIKDLSSGSAPAIDEDAREAFSFVEFAFFGFQRRQGARRPVPSSPVVSKERTTLRRRAQQIRVTSPPGRRQAPALRRGPFWAAYWRTSSVIFIAQNGGRTWSRNAPFCALPAAGWRRDRDRAISGSRARLTGPPAEFEARLAQRVVAVIARRRVPWRVGGVGGEFYRHDAGAHVVAVWQTEMLFRCDVAQQRATVPADHGGAMAEVIWS